MWHGGGDESAHKCRKWYLIAGLVSVALAWLFLTAGFGRYANEKGGAGDFDPDFGASFAFTVIMWLVLFPYAFLWVMLFMRKNDTGAGADTQAEEDGKPDQNVYTPSYSVQNAGATATGAKKPAAANAEDTAGATATGAKKPAAANAETKKQVSASPDDANAQGAPAKGGKAADANPDTSQGTTSIPSMGNVDPEDNRA